MGIYDASFNSQYQPNTSLLLQMERLLSDASHASIAKDIGKELTSLQNSVSKANTNEYARKLEMMTPEEVLAMEAQGLDPRTARLGNGFIYNPEDEAIKDAFKNLKSKTASELTGKVKRSKDRLTEKEKKELRKKGPVSVEDLLDLAGVSSAYTNRADIQAQADALNSAFDSQAQQEAMTFLGSLPVDDDRVRAFWNGDNSFFTDRDFSPEDAALFGDALRNSAEGRALITSRLNDLFKREQAENALNNVPLESAADWLYKKGYGTGDIAINAIDENSDAFAAMRNAVEAEKNKVIAADAKARINESVRKEENVSPADLQRYLTSATKEELADWVTTSTGTKAIGSLAKTFVNQLEKEHEGISWKKLVDPTTNYTVRKQMETTLLKGIDDKLTAYNLQDIPAVREAVKQNLMLTINEQLMSQLGSQDVATKNAVRSSLSRLSTTLGTTGDSSLTGLVRDWIEGGKSGLEYKDISPQDLRDFSEDPNIKRNMKALFGRLKHLDPNDDEARQELTNLIYNYMLPREVDTFGSNMTLLDYLKAKKGARNLTTKGKSEILGGKREMVTPSALAEYILGGDIAKGGQTSDPQFNQLLADQEAIIDLLDRALEARKSKKEREKLEDVLKTYTPH